MRRPPRIISQRRPTFWWWGGGIAVLAGAVFLFFFDPSTHGFYPRCPFYSGTGLYCPGCGALRGMHQLVHGHFLAALHMNPLLFLLVPALGGVYLWRRARADDQPALDDFSTRPLRAGLWLAVIVLFWVLRNIPAYPFTLLAP